jgi:hypothetical protein
MRNSLFGRLVRSVLAASLFLPALAASALAHPPMMPPHGFGIPAHSRPGAPLAARHRGPWATGIAGSGWDAAPSASSAETFSPIVTTYNVSYPDLVKTGGDCVILKLNYDGAGRFVGTRRVNAC